jgi:hypothetical protein
VEDAVAEAVTAKIEAAMEVIAPASPETLVPETLAPETLAPETPALETVSLEDVASEVEALLEAAAETPPAPAAAAAETPQPVAPAHRSIMTASASQPAPQPMAERMPAHDKTAHELAHDELAHDEPASQAPVVAMDNSQPHAAPAADAAPESAAVVAAEGRAAENPAADNDLWADIEAEIAPLPPFDPAHEDSLGASLIAQGVVARPANGRADLLAPIRRMSHAERIAFFS